MIEDVDVREFDPYKTYRRYGKVKEVMGENKNDLPARLIDNLSETVIDRMPHIGTGYAAYSPCYQCPIIMKYSYSFFPNEEILEHISYPGLTSFMVLDNYSGKVLYDLKEFPFALLEFPAITHGSKYLAAGHMEMVSREAKYLPYEDYFSMASILNMETGEICYSDATDEGPGTDERYGTAVNKETGRIVLARYNQRGNYNPSFLIGDALYSIEFPNVRKPKYSSESITFFNSDKKTLRKVYFDIDFDVTLLCD
jgi:hypothetical protein